MEKTLSPSLSRLDKDKDDSSQTEAYLLTEMRANYKQRDFLNEKVVLATPKAQRAYRHLGIHLLNCARIYGTGKWHGMHSEDVLKAKLPGGHRLSSTSALWDFERSIVQSRNSGEYFRPKRGLPGRTREYRIDPAFAIQFWEKADGAAPNYKLHTEDGEAGKRVYGSPALKTTLRDDLGNRWGEERSLPGGHYSLVDGALRVLSDREHKIDISAVTEMKEILREEYETAVFQLRQAEAEYEKYAHLDEEGGARTEKEANKIREARLKVKEMQTRKEKAERRYHSVLSGLEIIARQADCIEDCIAYIQNAYEVQHVSGRFSFKKGGPQGLPAVLKAFAYSFEDVYNYDIRSSQTTGLRQLAGDLRKVGCDVDSEVLDTYIDRGGKDWVTDNYDLPRPLVQRVEHAIKFGASIPDSMEQAYHQKTNTRWGMPEIAKHVEGYYTGRDEQNRVLSDLGEIFGPQVQMIEDLAEGLLEDYWEAHSYAGGWGKGRIMRNHCGITFCKYDYDGGHEARSKAMAWYLQGLEAAYVHAITILSEEYDYEVMANEHDGCICVGTIPYEAKERAQKISGFREAKLVDKRFEDEEVVQEAANALGRDSPSPPLEPTPSPRRTHQSKTQQTSPGANPSKKEASKGDSTNATPAADRSNGPTPQSGNERVNGVREPANDDGSDDTFEEEPLRILEKHDGRESEPIYK